MSEELSDEQLAEAAAGDLTVLAVLMLVGSTAFSLVNKWLGTMGWIAVALTIAGTLTWSTGLFRRSAVIAAFVKIGFAFSGLDSGDTHHEEHHWVVRPSRRLVATRRRIR